MCYNVLQFQNGWIFRNRKRGKGGDKAGHCGKTCVVPFLFSQSLW